MTHPEAVQSVEEVARPMRRYFFAVPGFGRVEELGRTKSAARYRLWLRFSEAYPCSFPEFLRGLSK